MHFRHGDGSTVHLAYCTNVHPAEDLDGVVAQVRRFAGPVRERLDWPLLGVGLWLAAPLARALVADASLVTSLRRELDRQRLEVVTLNGFPHHAFQSEVVKRDVYTPDWTDPERLRFTLDLATVLHRLLPDDATHGSVSTLPLGWRDIDVVSATQGLRSLAGELRDLNERNGRAVRVAVEPEPGCLVETIDQAVDVLQTVDSEVIGLCLDACHLAVQFEDAESAVSALADAGVPVVKSQISSALRVPASSDRDWLDAFVEPRFLHQARELRSGTVRSVDDLDEAFEVLDASNEWRVHFHVPVHEGGSRTTQRELRSTIEALVGGPSAVTHHLEVETYTWNVLPEHSRPAGDDGLVEGLAMELSWVADRLVELGLEPEGAA